MTDDDAWGSPKPTDDDGPEAEFDRAWKRAEREDERERKRQAARRRLWLAVEAYRAKGGKL